MKNKEIVKSIVVLVVICLLTSAALAVVNHFTAPVSAANAEARAQQARLDAVPDAADFAPIEAALPSGVVSAYAALDAAGTPTSYLFTFSFISSTRLCKCEKSIFSDKIV